MDININILDSFPSIEKLATNNNIILEINNKEYNLNKIITNNELITLYKASNKIIFKIYFNNKELFGTYIFKIDKFKELFSLDGNSYVLWLEFKKENTNVNEEYNLIFYNSIRLKVKFIPSIALDDLIIIRKRSNDNNIKTINNNIYENKLSSNTSLSNDKAHFSIDTNINKDNFFLSSNNFYKKKYEDDLYRNITEESLNDNKNINNINANINDHNNNRIKKIKSTKSNEMKDNSHYNSIVNKRMGSNNNSYKNRIKSSSKKRISNKTSNNLNKQENNFLLTENNFYLNHSYKFPKKINKSLGTKNNILDSKNNLNRMKTHKTPNKININIGEMNELKKAKSINHVKKVSDDSVRTTIITNQNNIKQNIIVNLNGSYNKNNTMNKNIKNKSVKESDSIKQNNNNIYHTENQSNLFNISKPLNMFNNNYINENSNNRYEKGQIESNNFKESDEKNKNSIDNDSNENDQLIKNINISNNSININEITINKDINNINDNQDNYLSEKLFFNENEIFKEFNSIRNNFELLYSKAFINNIKKDLIDFEFNLALEKIMELFTCYNSEVEYLFYKNNILRNTLKHSEMKLKCIRKKINKLNNKKEELKLKQNRMIFLKESEFYFIEDIKMQKITQKKLLESLIKNKMNQKLKLLIIFKEIFKKRKNLFNLQNNNITTNNNINTNNNPYRNNTERGCLNKVIQMNNNNSNKLFKNINNDNNIIMNYNNNYYYKMKTPKITKDMKKYKMNSLTTNRYSDFKNNNMPSPYKSFKNSMHINKSNGSYCFTNGNNNISSSKNKYFK